MMKLLISAPYFLPVLDRFREELEQAGFELVVPDVEERLEESELLSIIPDITAVIAGDDRFTRPVIEAATSLRVICKWGTGTDSFDHAACKEHGVKITNTPDAFTVPVSESVLSYALAFARRQPWMDQAMKAGTWEKIPGRTLAESTFGIVGVGNIGSAVARRLRAFGANVLGYDPRPISSDLIAATALSPVELPRLLAESHFVSINCDLNPSSHHLMNSERLSLMRRDAVLINTARGPCVDERALVRALKDGEIAGAALDVFEYEPLPSDSELKSMSQVMLAPHNTNSSPRAWGHVHRNTISNLFNALGVSAS
ncbi:MAG: phosphoglycerate dehydrogenase [Nannocystaceae bacterium]